MKEKHPFKMKTNPDNASIELRLPFTITWKKKNYEGIIYLKLSAKSELLDYGIEWIDKAPDFGHAEIEAFEKIEDALTDKIYNRLKNIIENLDLSEFEIT
jgi:hypothetical protein